MDVVPHAFVTDDQPPFSALEARKFEGFGSKFLVPFATGKNHEFPVHQQLQTGICVQAAAPDEEPDEPPLDGELR